MDVWQRGHGQTRDLIVCYYVAGARKEPICELAPSACIVNYWEDVTAKYAGMHGGILSIEKTIDWARRNAGLLDVDRVILVGFSAGCQAPRTLLRQPGRRPDAIVAVDGIHASNPPEDWQLRTWQAYAADAVADRAVLVASTTEIEPPTFLGTRKTLRLITGLELEDGPTTVGGMSIWACAGSDAASHHEQSRRIPEFLGLALDLLHDHEPRENTTMPVPSWQNPALTLGERCVQWSMAEREAGVSESTSAGLHRIAEYFEPCERNGKKLGISTGPWCAAFASAALEACILPDENRPHGYRAATIELGQDALERGTFIPANEVQAGRYVPEIGDLCLMARPAAGNSWAGHVCRVVSWGGSKFETIGGNESDSIRITERGLMDPQLRGFVRYSEITPELRERAKTLAGFLLDELAAKAVA